jgi:hypothetical protein
MFFQSPEKMTDNGQRSPTAFRPNLNSVGDWSLATELAKFIFSFHNLKD